MIPLGVLASSYVAPAGTSVSVRGAQWGTAGAISDAPTVSAPVTVDSGDLLVALLVHSSSRTVTGPTGLGASWSEEFSYLPGPTSYGYHRWYVGTGGSGTGSVSWSLNIISNCWARLWVITGLSGTLTGAADNAISTSLTHTRTGGGDLLLASGYVGGTQPAGWLTGSGWDDISEADGRVGAAHLINVGSSISITPTAVSTTGLAATSALVS